MVPGSPSGQQAYKSNVRLHTNPVIDGRCVKCLLGTRVYQVYVIHLYASHPDIEEKDSPVAGGVALM